MGELNILAIIPTYNEAESIVSLIEKFFNKNSKLSVLIIDDNSPDGTSLKVRKFKTKYPNLYLITRNSHLGLGGAYIVGFNYAIRIGYDLVVQMDADLSHDPAYIPKMLELTNNYDLVIGSRYIKNGGIESCSWNRFLLSKMANRFTKLMLGIPIFDSTSGFKVVKSSLLEKIDFKTMTSKGYALQIEMVYRAFLKGFKIVEYPIIFKGRKSDKSKMTLGITAEALFRVLGWSLVRYYTALKRLLARD
jgi:dolichol-phosphate mannosyltransferase